MSIVLDGTTGITTPAETVSGTGVWSVGGTQIYKDSSGNVGIGTSSPTQKLTVSGNGIVSGSFTVGQGGIGDSVLQVYSASYGGLRIGYNSTAVNYIDSGTLYLRNASGSSTFATLDSSGNLGLGVTPSAWGSGSQALQNQAGALFAVSSGSLRLFQNAYYNGTNNIYVNTAAATGYIQSGGQHQWFYAASGSAGTNATFTQAMTLDASGNLGVGTSSPTSALNIAKSSSIITVTSTGNNAAYSLYQANSSGLPFYVGQDNSTGASFFGTAYAGIISTTGAYPVIFGTNFTERARIDSSGNFITNVNGTAPTLSTNSQMTFELTNNTTLKIKVRGTDGTTRSVSLVLV